MAVSNTLQRWANAFAARITGKNDLFSPVAAGHLVDLMFSFADPDEILSKAGKTRVELRKVAADDEVATALDTRLAAVVGTPWRLEPGTGPAVEFVWAELERLAIPLIEAAWQAMPYGYSVAETIWTRTDKGRVTIAKIEERPFEWFTPQRDGTLVYHEAGSWSGMTVDTVDKFVLTRNRPSWRNPRGEALLSRCYWPWFLRSSGWRMWARFLERSASPVLLGKSNNTKAMAEALALAVQSAVAAVGREDDVQSIAPNSKNGDAYVAFQEAVDARIQKAILGQTLTTDVKGNGSYAAAKVHDLVRMDRRMADIRMVTASVQQVVNSLCKYNFPGVAPPKFIMEDSTGLEIERAERDVKLASTGQVRFTEAYLLNRYDFEPGDIVVVEPAPPPPQLAQEPQESTPAQLSALRHAFARTSPQIADRQAAIDALVAQSVQLATSPIDPAALRAAIREATDPDDLIDRLAVLGDALPAAEFSALVERCLFAADVMGYVHDAETVQ